MKHGKAFCLLFLLVVSSFVRGSEQERGVLKVGEGYVIQRASSLQNLPRRSEVSVDEVPDVNEVELSAARREAESFQIVVTPTGDESIPVKNISLPTLTGPDDQTIPGKYIQMYAVGFINGNDPDVLFPYDDVRGEFRTAFPDQNLTFWCTVNVPDRVNGNRLPSGTYRGNVRVMIGRGQHELPIRFRVQPFSLPEETTVWTQLFPIHDRQICEYYGIEPGSTRFKELFHSAKAHFQSARISPEWPTPVAPRTRYFTQPIPRIVDEGRYGSAMSFDELGMVVPDSRDLVAPQMTVSAWVYPEHASHDYPIVWKRTGGDNTTSGGFSLRMRVVNGGMARKLHTWLDTGVDEPVHLQAGGFTPSNEPIWGRWYHVAMTFDGTSVRLYVDGKLANETTASGGIQKSEVPLMIGAYGRQHERDHLGRLDEVRLYDRALSEDEVDRDMQSEDPLPGSFSSWGFDGFDDRPSRMLRYLPDTHICSDRARNWYMSWAERWHDEGLYVGRIPMPYEDQRTAELFAGQYVEPLRKEGLLDRTYVRLPDEAFYPDTDGRRRAIRGGTMMNEQFPDVQTHMTFNGLFYKKTNPDLKIRTLRAFQPATDIWSINPSESHLSGVAEEVRMFFNDRSERVSWYIHHHLNIREPGKTLRGFFTQMWQEDIHQLTLWNTMIWDRTNPERVERGYRQDGLGGNGLLFWPGSNQIHSSMRVERIRDGIEDWLYYRKLQECADRTDDLPDALETQVEKVLNRSLIEGMKGLQFALDDPNRLIEHRKQVAELIRRVNRERR